MRTRDFIEKLDEALHDAEHFDGEDAPAVDHTESLKDSSFLTRDEGLVVRLDDGSTFLLTVQRYEGARDGSDRYDEDADDEELEELEEEEG